VNADHHRARADGGCEQGMGCVEDGCTHVADKPAELSATARLGRPDIGVHQLSPLRNGGQREQLGPRPVDQDTQRQAVLTRTHMLGQLQHRPGMPLGAGPGVQPRIDQDRVLAAQHTVSRFASRSSRLPGNYDNIGRLLSILAVRTLLPLF
jgi:hypothetical protein